MKRGIATTITAPAQGCTIQQVYAIWEKAYQGRRFIGILQSGCHPDTAHVANSNRVDMSASADPRTGNLVITTAMDNLIKGAGGQAIQIMNLIAGLDEATGLA